jgi:phosphate transport system protein
MPIAGQHTDQQYQAQLQELKDRLLAMGGRCERTIALAMRAIEEGDDALAREVEAADRSIDADELAIDGLAVRILARRQPLGRDLRFLVAALKVVVSLERIGDEAVNIAERAPKLAGRMAEVEAAQRAIPEMARRSGEMLRGALDAFVRESSEEADRVLAMDDEVDRLYEAVVGHATRVMGERPDRAELALTVARTAKSLERIADQCTNVAEMVVYLDEGIDVRHGRYRRDAR